MLQLVKDGYNKKTDTDRSNYGLQLKKALEDFTNTFLPHMQEEEEVCGQLWCLKTCTIMAEQVLL